MEIEFASDELEARFLSSREGTRAWGANVARAYIKRVTFLAQAEDVRAVRAYRGLRLHSLRGASAGHSAIDLVGRWRLIVTIAANTVRIEEVSNHYGD